MPFICETSATPNYPLTYNCSKGWVYFEPTHSCYGINKFSFGGSWTAANNNCKGFNAFLPTISSYEEIKFVASYVYYTDDQTWIGVYSDDNGKTWETVDGSVTKFLDFASWCTGFPEFQNGKRCVAMGFNSGVDECYRYYECSNTTVPYTICKKPL